MTWVNKELPMTLWSNTGDGEPAWAEDLNGIKGPSWPVARIEVVTLRRAMPETETLGSRQAVLRSEVLGPAWP